jgi:type 1 glutamine amidotransferase
MKKFLTFAMIWAVAALAFSPAAAHAEKLRVLIVDGQNNHDWRSTTPIMKAEFEKHADRFKVDVTSNLGKADKKPGHSFETVPFPPDLSKYDVIVSNYNGGSWPKEFNDALDARLKEGKIGLVIVHAANNAFGGWKEYNQMIGMGWRDAKYGKRLKLDDEGKTVMVPAGEDQGSGHRYTGDFQVVLRDAAHPVVKGMPKEWMHARDELYDNMRGPIENVHLIATAYSKGTKTNEPMIWTVSYGKGKVFHTPMGHDANAMRCVGYLTTLLRGTEWAGDGMVTIAIPADFPTAEKTSSVGSAKK